MSSADTGATLCYWQNSRSGEVLDHMLRHGMQKNGSVYEGAILSDGYGRYESWMKSLPADQKPQWQVCWAHVRRKFVEAACSSNDPVWSRKMVELIRPLYDIERALRESKAPPEEVKQKRKDQSRPIAVGRKNCLFIGAPEAGQRAAIIYSMVEECKRTGTDFNRWLTEVLRKLPTYRVSDGYLNLLPGMLKLESPAQNGRNVTL